ncbi:YhcN/YlaJ family sporulation lipoprotein [Bacillus sp. sid0103]|uniref:YhcN/YlaJ family sporulation lipoprotein n=1 Tax=Bacillus sp. sid0103 TaxID=2856337 RepID=UPI001C46A1C8|nr:YhcN/YlaJ family sporulation lipoprotein [Bacillus sp. sid0103]MBV7505961.1 YhcN/YlaJ family sporulation lipoprotein [Bacillus sp. sid0103]
MNRKQWMIPLSATLMLGLAGCASNNDRAGNNNNSLRPVGYYSNENHPNSNNDLFRDDDGAFTEMMDHTLGDEDQATYENRRRQFQTRDENGNPKNPTKPLASKDRNFFQRDNRFSTSDMNYHGHLNVNTRNTGMTTDPDFQDNVTNKIKNAVSAVPKVQSVRSVAYGNTIIVSVNLNDNDNVSATKSAIRKAVKPYANGRSVKVIFDEGTIGRDKNIYNDSQREQGGR